MGMHRDRGVQKIGERAMIHDLVTSPAALRPGAVAGDLPSSRPASHPPPSDHPGGSGWLNGIKREGFRIRPRTETARLP